MSEVVLVWAIGDDGHHYAGEIHEDESPWVCVFGETWAADLGLRDGYLNTRGTCTSIDDGKAQAAAWLAERGVTVRS